MQSGLRRRNFRVQNLDVSGTIVGGGTTVGPGNVWYVDASKTSGISGNGTTWDEAVITIQEGVTLASAGDTVYVAAKDITDYTGDPTSYAETIIIPYATSSLALIGVSRGRTQGGLPQIKKGSGATALLTIRAPGCLIANLGFNGISSTGGGILLDDDYAAKSAFGTTIVNCHLKNCVGSTANNAATGGAIMWTSAGNAWQVLVSGCRFYKCVGDIVMPGTSNTVPQDVVVEDCIMSGPAGATDCNIYVGGSGINGLYINRCIFPALPALGGTNDRYMILTSCVGVVSNCTFGSVTSGTGTTITFKASGTGAEVPATMMLCGNYGTTDAAGETSEVSNA